MDRGDVWPGERDRVVNEAARLEVGVAPRDRTQRGAAEGQVRGPPPRAAANAMGRGVTSKASSGKLAPPMRRVSIFA